MASHIMISLSEGGNVKEIIDSSGRKVRKTGSKPRGTIRSLKTITYVQIDAASANPQCWLYIGGVRYRVC
jgi:hypothetical protein